jgi:hypothetical protein
MSVMEADDQDSGTVLHYAPRHVRLPAEERSIRPILERLSRGENEVRTESRPEPVRIEHLIPLEAPRRKFGWQLIACSALSAGLSAGLAVLAIVWFAPGKTEFTRIDAAQLDPKAVRTVSFKQDAPPVAAAATTAAAAPAESDLQKQAPEAAPPIQPKEVPPPSKAEIRDRKPEAQDHQIAPKELLALWSGVPADVAADVPAEPAAEAPAPPAANAAELAVDEADQTPARETPVRAATHTRRHPQARHRTHAARVHVARTQQEAQSATAAASTNANAAPLQSAFQSLFSRSAAGAQPSQQQQGY